jgi:hypothetical protein
VTTRSIPFNFGPGTCLRLDRGDIEAIEDNLGFGFPHFGKESVFGSLTATTTIVWRGLKVENPEGKLVHVFPLNAAGREQAGDAVWEAMQKGRRGDLELAIVDALVATGLYPKKEKKPDEVAESAKGPEIKNLQT